MADVIKSFDTVDRGILDLACCIVWFRFRMVRRYLAYRPAGVGRVYRLLDMVREGCLGHGPVQLLVASATAIRFQWDPHTLGGVRPGQLVLSNLAGLIQHYKSAILDTWQDKVTADFCARKGFRGGPLLDATGSTLQLFNSAHVREIRHCAEVSWLVVLDSCWRGCVASVFRAGSVVVRMEMGIFLGECTFPPLVEIRENPEFHDLMGMDKAHWPRCLLWHGWLSPWAETAASGAGHLLESALGSYSSRLLFEWSLPDECDAITIA